MCENKNIGFEFLTKLVKAMVDFISDKNGIFYLSLMYKF